MKLHTRQIARLPQFLLLLLLLAAGYCLPPFPDAFAASEESVYRVQQQYVAFYGRPGDLPGVFYWADRLEAGGGLSAIQSAFADSEEFRNRIIPGSATSVAELTRSELNSLVNRLYQNMFGRDGDPRGMQYWVGELESGDRSLADISTALAEGAPVSSDDYTLLQNRVILAQYISEEIDLKAIAYGNAQIDTARDFLFSSIDGLEDNPFEVDITPLLRALEANTNVNLPPVADAGPDQTVSSGEIVFLNGTGSKDSDGSIHKYSWEQLATTIINRKQPRIINGSKAGSGQFPWQVALLTDPQDGFASQTCGGSIIHERWILTAAHCYSEGEETYVAAASLSLYKLNPDYMVKAKRWILHPDFDIETLDNDIALLELNSPLNLAKCNGRCSAIGLVNRNNETSVASASRPAIVSGWGNTSRVEEIFSHELLWAELAIIDCKASPSMYTDLDITDNMICAAAPAFDTDSCQGDSGGPLVVANGSGYLLAGIVSWGNGCAVEGYPGVFSRVANYTKWIDDQTGGDCCSGSTSDGDGGGNPEDTRVQISNRFSATPSFTAPAVEQATNLYFKLTVTDNENSSSSDQVAVTIMPAS
ncbi:MAG: hypothetical protein CSA52_01350 [Gammaproteobacteria bacterium]|nr:MAG: hypothetical protein CSB48_09860 [Pseudomonadota bacterium]PIE38726.1 MAG: hypothetical protein CSA52_01350 [Gammaproteobacteria bacterium]